MVESQSIFPDRCEKERKEQEKKKRVKNKRRITGKTSIKRSMETKKKKKPDKETKPKGSIQQRKYEFKEPKKGTNQKIRTRAVKGQN